MTKQQRRSSMNRSFWQDIAVQKGLQGNDLRVIAFCFRKDRMQKDIQIALGMKKQNVSNICRKLEKANILSVEHQAGVKFYRVNEDWKNDIIPGQQSFVMK